MFRRMISESENEFKELSLQEEKLNSDIDNEEIAKNQAIKKSIKVSLKLGHSSAPNGGLETVYLGIVPRRQEFGSDNCRICRSKN